MFSSINLADFPKDFRKKEIGEIKYFRKLKSERFSLENKTKKRESKNRVPIILKKVKNPLERKKTIAENKIAGIKRRYWILFSFSPNFLIKIQEKITKIKIKTKKEIPIGFP